EEPCEAGLIHDGTTSARTESLRERGYRDRGSLIEPWTQQRQSRSRSTLRTEEGSIECTACFGTGKERVRRWRLILRWSHLSRLCHNQIEGSHFSSLAMELQLETILQHCLQHLLKLRRLAVLELLESVRRSASWDGRLEIVEVGRCPLRL